MTAKGRNLRIATQCQVLIDHRGRRISAHSEDISARGIFVRTRTPFEIGSQVDIHLTVPSHPPFSLRGQVVHALGVAEARALARAPGIGFEFIDGDVMQLRAHLEVLSESRGRVVGSPSRARVLLVDAHEPMLARLRNAMPADIVTRVDTLTDCAEAMVAVLEQPPSAIIAAAEMSGMSGIELLERIREHERLARIPVLVMVGGGDMARLDALRSGASDVIARPFTDEELEIRLRRLLTPREQPDASLHGSLAAIGLGTVLSLLEFERKSGKLVVVHEREDVVVHIVDGRIVGLVGLTESLSPEERLMCVLEWHAGRFEWHTGATGVDHGFDLGIQGLLLEHARVVDEG